MKAAPAKFSGQLLADAPRLSGKSAGGSTQDVGSDSSVHRNSNVVLACLDYDKALVRLVSCDHAASRLGTRSPRPSRRRPTRPCDREAVQNGHQARARASDRGCPCRAVRIRALWRAAVSIWLFAGNEHRPTPARDRPVDFAWFRSRWPNRTASRSLGLVGRDPKPRRGKVGTGPGPGGRRSQPVARKRLNVHGFDWTFAGSRFSPNASRSGSYEPPASAGAYAAGTRRAARPSRPLGNALHQAAASFRCGPRAPWCPLRPRLDPLVL